MRVLVCVLTILSLRGMALAQDAGAVVAEPVKASAMTDATEMIIQMVGAVLAAALVLLVKKAITYFEAKTKIDIPLQTEKMMESIAEKAANYAREKAHQANQASPNKMKGPEKMEAALTFGLDLAQQYKLDEIAREKLTRAIEAQLGKERENV